METQEIVYLEEGIKFDADSNIFRNLKLLGFKSANNRVYTAECIQKAVNLYENRPVYLNHKVDRTYEDRIGTIVNPKYCETTGLRGDMLLNPKHSIAQQVQWDIEHNTPGVGFSHTVRANCLEGKETIIEITEVKSIDIVCSPATNNSFKESTDVDRLFESKLEAMGKEIDELKDEIKKLNSKRLNMMEIPQETKVNNEQPNDWLRRLTRIK